MIPWLIKATNEFRLETLEEVEKFHKQLQKEATQYGITLSSFSWKEVEKKSKQEVIDSWFIVKYTFIFNNSKEPDKLFNIIKYHGQEYLNNDDSL